MSTSSALAQEAGPAWSQYQGGPAHSGSLKDGPQPPFRIRWTLPAPAGEALSPAVIDAERAYALGSEAVYAIDLATGEATELAPRDGGPLSPPAIAQVGSTPALLFLEGPPAAAEPSPAASPEGSPSPGTDEEEPRTSTLVAVSLADGSELWRAPLGAVSRSGVAVEGDTAYVGDGDGNVVAVSLADGAERWAAEVPGRVDQPVAVADGIVYAVGRDGRAPRLVIVALDATTGEEAWRSAPEITSAVGSGPAAGEGFVLVGSADRLLRSIGAGDGAERWAALTLSFFSPATVPALADGAVYAVDLGGGLYRFDAADGERAWSHQLNETVVRGAPVVSGPTVLLGLNDGRLVAVDAGTGHLVWGSEPTPGLIGTIALGPDVVVAVKGGQDAGLVAFEPDPDGTLVDVPPPTELDVGVTLGRYALAAALVAVGALVPGIWLRRRLGPPDLGGEVGDEGEQEDEP